MTIDAHHIRVAKRARYYTIGPGGAVDDVWVVCHGYGQLAGRFIEKFQGIAAPNRLLVAPEALHRFYLDPPPAPAVNRRVGATWMTREDRETDIADYVDYLDLLVSEILSHSPQARLRVLGFSQGSATVLRWVVRASRVPDHLIIWAGEVPRDVDWQMGARKLAATRIDAVRGETDDAMPEPVVMRNLDALTKVGLAYQLHSFGGGHQIDDVLLRRLAEF
jgi:predicted esterase